jgi:hypothetical protein
MKIRIAYTNYAPILRQWHIQLQRRNVPDPVATAEITWIERVPAFRRFYLRYKVGGNSYVHIGRLCLGWLPNYYRIASKAIVETMNQIHEEQIQMEQVQAKETE